MCIILFSHEMFEFSIFLTLTNNGFLGENMALEIYFSVFLLKIEKQLHVNPWNHRKKSYAKAPEPIYRLYFGRCLQKAQGS
jgi:hypothetical protein